MKQAPTPHTQTQHTTHTPHTHTPHTPHTTPHHTQHTTHNKSNLIWPNSVWPNSVWPNLFGESRSWQSRFWQSRFWPKWVWPKSAMTDPLMPVLHALGQHQALCSVQSQLLQDERLFAFHDDIHVVSQPERTVEIHDILREGLWDYSRIQIHAGKTQIWNRGGTFQRTMTPFCGLPTLRIQRRRFGLATLKLQKSGGSKFWGVLWELAPSSGHGFSLRLNTIGCFLTAS